MPKRSYRSSKSSTWSDYYTDQAKQLGFLARSVFKLEQLEEKFRFLAPLFRADAPRILDLGAAPGSWVQWCLSHKKLKSAKIFSVDLQNLDATLSGQKNRVTHILGDMCSENVFSTVSHYAPFAVILCDAAPASTGQKLVDAARAHTLNRCATRYALTYLSEGGSFVCKVFSQQYTEDLCTTLQQHFTRIQLYKPRSSRSASREHYLLALHKKASYNANQESAHATNPVH